MNYNIIIYNSIKMNTVFLMVLILSGLTKDSSANLMTHPLHIFPAQPPINGISSSVHTVRCCNTFDNNGFQCEIQNEDTVITNALNKSDLLHCGPMKKAINASQFFDCTTLNLKLDDIMKASRIFCLKNIYRINSIFTLPSYFFIRTEPDHCNITSKKMQNDVNFICQSTFELLFLFAWDRLKVAANAIKNLPWFFQCYSQAHQINELFDPLIFYSQDNLNIIGDKFRLISTFTLNTKNLLRQKVKPLIYCRPGLRNHHFINYVQIPHYYTANLNFSLFSNSITGTRINCICTSCSKMYRFLSFEKYFMEITCFMSFKAKNAETLEVALKGGEGYGFDCSWKAELLDDPKAQGLGYHYAFEQGETLHRSLKSLKEFSVAIRGVLKMVPYQKVKGPIMCHPIWPLLMNPSHKVFWYSEFLVSV